MMDGKIAVLFPGQGSQYVGMGKELAAASPAGAELFDLAEEVTRLPLRRLCFEGPMEELTAAVNLQPALTAVNLLAWQGLRAGGLRADFVAGHSLGEYSALHAAGCLSLSDTFTLVGARGRIMDSAGQGTDSGMAAILGLDIEAVRGIVEGCGAPGRLTIGNHNSEKQIVISGERALLERACAAAAEKGAKTVVLNVSIANHSPLMAEAVPPFAEIMAEVEFSAPGIPLYFNVSAAPENDPAAIRDLMARQIVSMVRWHEIITALVAQGVTTFIEAGPKKVLTGLLKRSLPKGGGFACYQVDTPAAVDSCLKAVGVS